jgi:hypothetical protein
MREGCRNWVFSAPVRSHGSGDSRPQRDANRDFSDRHQSPEGDQQLSGERHDHCLLALPSSIVGSASVPLRQGAFLLKAQEAPRQSNETATHPRVARLGQTLLTSFRPALVWRPGEAGVTSHGPSVSQVSGQNFLHQHIRRLDADADDARQHPNHRMPASGRRPLQALQPSLLDGVDLLADPSQSGHVASHPTCWAELASPPESTMRQASAAP